MKIYLNSGKYPGSEYIIQNPVGKNYHSRYIKQGIFNTGIGYKSIERGWKLSTESENRVKVV